MVFRYGTLVQHIDDTHKEQLLVVVQSMIAEPTAHTHTVRGVLHTAVRTVDGLFLPTTSSIRL